MVKKQKNRSREHPVGFAGIARLLTDLDNELSMDGNSSKENKDTIQHKNSGQTNESIERNDGDARVFTWWVIVICLVLLVVFFFSAVGKGNNNERDSTSYVAERSASSRTSNGASRYSTNQSTSANRTRPTNSSTTRNNRTIDTAKPNESVNRSLRDYSFPGETIPRSGTGYTLTKQQIKYCLAEDLRIDAARVILDSKEEILSQKIDIWSNLKEANFSTSREYREYGGQRTQTEYNVVVSRLEKLSFETISWKLENWYSLFTKTNAYKSSCRDYYRDEFCRNLINEIKEIIFKHVKGENAIYDKLRVKFNTFVNSYNKRCSEYSYYRDDKKLAESEIKNHREHYIEQGRLRME